MKTTNSTIMKVALAFLSTFVPVCAQVTVTPAINGVGSQQITSLNTCGVNMIVVCPNPKFLKIWGSGATSATHTDLTTAASGSGSAYSPAAASGNIPARAFWLMGGIANDNNTGGTCQFYIRHSGADFALAATASAGTAPAAVAFNLVVPAGDSLRFQCGGTTGQNNAWVWGVEYDAVSGAPKSSITYTLTSGDNTLYTVTGGKTSLLLATAVSAPAVLIMNDSGVSRTYSIYLVPSGGAKGVSNNVGAAVNPGNNILTTLNMRSLMLGGDFIVINSDASTTNQTAWVTYAEF